MTKAFIPLWVQSELLKLNSQASITMEIPDQVSTQLVSKDYRVLLVGRGRRYLKYAIIKIR